MKSNILKYLLITSVLAGCGGSGGSNSSTSGGGQGAGQTSQGGSNSTGGSGSSAVSTSQLPQKQDPDLKKFLSKNNLQSQYAELLNLQKMFVEQLKNYDPDNDKDIKFAREIADNENTKRLLKLRDEIGSRFVQYKTEALKSEGFSLYNFNENGPAPDWLTLRKLGRTFSQYPEELNTEQVYDILFNSSELRIPQDEKYYRVVTSAAPSDNDSIQNPIVESLEEYKKVLSQNFDRSLLYDKLILGCKNRIKQILTGSVVGSRPLNKLSDDGQKVINALNLSMNEYIQDDPNPYISAPNWYDLLKAITFELARKDDPAQIDIKLKDYTLIVSSMIMFKIKASYMKDTLSKQDSLDTLDTLTNLAKLNPNSWLEIKRADGGDIYLLKQDALSVPIFISDESVNAIGEDVADKIIKVLKTLPEFKDLFTPLPSAAEGLSATTPDDASRNANLRHARNGDTTTGSVSLNGLSINDVAGDSIELGIPLYVKLKGNVSSSKATEAATGSVAYRLGNTVIGAIQGYANSGEGFGVEGRQYETSLAVSQSFGAFFIEGQLGSVSATDVHQSNWSGMRSQVTLGVDTEFVSPFVQITHRHLGRDGLDLKQTTGYVGLEMDVANLKSDSYSVDASLLAKVGYGEKAWSEASKHLGTTSGMSGSVEWKGSLHLNTGISFNTSLSLDTTSKTSASVQFSVER
jgi:hypothetical protein